MTQERTSRAERGRTEGPGSAPHEIERAVLRLNAWFAAHKDHIPRCWNWGGFRRQRAIPVFTAVRTTAIKDWKAEDLKRLFRVRHMEVNRDDGDVEVPIELLVADRSPQGDYLEMRKLLNAAFDVFAARLLLGRSSPRLRWFWSHAASLTAEMETYVQEIRLRTDAALPVMHDQRRVFEEFQVPLQNGQQTAIGQSCFFVLDYAQPPGSVPYWRFSVSRHGEILVGPQVLHPKPIYHEDQLLAVIKQISSQSVTLSVLTSEGG